MSRPYNFSPGPAAVPQPVLERAQAELLDWQGSGVSVMEVSHRGKAFMALAEKAEADLRELLAIPDNYKVLFLSGGASMQFAMVPVNLLRGRSSADYICTGSWSKKAIKEAQRFCQVNIAASSEHNNFTSIPSRESWQCDAGAAYLHYTPNETIHGVEFSFIPEVDGDVPLVADLSSTLLSRPLDVSRFGLIYAGAQKNLGIAGLTVVIVREDLLGQALPDAPSLFDYKTQADSDSMSNTPVTFAWYIAGLVFEWLKDIGGLVEMEKRNQAKAELLYSAIDGSNYYRNPVATDCRSWMNVPFTLPDPSLDPVFLDEAEKTGLLALKGHRSVGGMRASLYNAMSEEGVRALVDFMADFSRRHG